ncbi:MAG TPA: hypothetical protein VF223_20890 [Trebonia sp.]
MPRLTSRGRRRLPGDGPDGRVTHKKIFKTFYGVPREAAGP